jgi:hypothetical protein
MTPYYMATWKFDQTSEGWVAYVTWRGLTQLVEVVSIECNCHRLLRKVLTAEDWVNIAPFDEVRHVVCFRDLARLRQTVARVGQTATLDLLCVFREPTKPPVAPQSAFTFLGYDLIDDQTTVSSVSNCKFPVIGEVDVNAHGLINTFERAKEIQRELLRVYPQDPHANCSLWAIFRVSK